ncbi:MAG: hypothetical protein ABWZ79_18255 [Pedobacter agri]
MLNYIYSWLKKIGLDAAIAYTVLSRVVQAGGGIIAIIFVARELTTHEQGYYYTFASIIAIQVFFELGLSSIITQYAAHEFAHLKFDEESNLEGSEIHQSRLASLLQFCMKWFGVISVVLFFALIVVGIFFFTNFSKDVVVAWKQPWIVLCLATSLNLFIDPILAFYDGLGRVKDMAQIRFIQRTANLLFLIFFFILGFKLYASAMASLLSIGINYFQIAFSRRKELLIKIWKAKTKYSINYFQEIFPFQWRIAVSWISGYFIYQLFNPVLFATEGPVVSGQMGITIQVLNGITAIVMSWITTKIPAFSNFIARKEYDQLDELFNSTLLKVSCLYVFFLVLFVLGVWFMHDHNFVYSARFLPIVPTIIMSVIFFLNQIVFSWATYIRCHKVEPYLVFSIVFAVLTSTSTFVLGYKFGLSGIVYGYATLTAVSFVVSYLIFIKQKNILHR